MECTSCSLWAREGTRFRPRRADALPLVTHGMQLRFKGVTPEAEALQVGMGARGTTSTLRASRALLLLFCGLRLNPAS
jgi:hypothetical protein